MADWTNIPDATFNQDRPVLGSTHLAIVRNFTAMANGASGAPKISANGLQAGNPERDWVLARTSGAGAGAVGTYALLGENTSTNTTFGNTRAGSSLFPMGLSSASPFSNDTASLGINGRGQNSAQAGTWRCMGTVRGGATGGGDPLYGASLWLRIS